MSTLPTSIPSPTNTVDIRNGGKGKELHKYHFAGEQLESIPLGLCPVLQKDGTWGRIPFPPYIHD